MSLLSCTLLVDDDNTTNYLNQRLLQRLHVADTVLVALNGAEALDLLDAHCTPVASPTCPALVLLDLKMPVMDGFSFLEEYTQHPRVAAKAVVIIMLTTSLNSSDVERMQRFPIAGYLTKPLTQEKITAILTEHFDYKGPAAD